MTWLRGCRETESIVRLIGLLGHLSFDEIVLLPWIADELVGLLQEHKRAVALIEERLVFDGRVATYDLSEDGVTSHSSFAAYMFCPDASYSIGLTQASGVANISIGHNPWATVKPRHNIARLCESHGGGGHPHVGGIALPAEDLRRAREVVEELRQALWQPEPI